MLQRVIVISRITIITITLIIIILVTIVVIKMIIKMKTTIIVIIVLIRIIMGRYRCTFLDWSFGLGFRV